MNSNTNTVIAYGICADNVDPYGVGRIRVVVDDMFAQPVLSALNVKEFLAKIDADNAKLNGESAYVPWEIGGNNRRPDPYVFEPFLPKHVNIIPKIGEAVKIIYYTVGDDRRQREYIGPVISNYDKTNYDALDSARSFSTKSTHQPAKNNLRDTDLVADAEDVALYGRNNSELVLPDNEAFLLAGNQNFIEKFRNKRNGLIQVSHYNSSRDIVTETVNIDNSESKIINYMVEFETVVGDKTVTPNYITTTVSFYKTTETTRNYNAYKEYLTDPETVEYIFTMSSANTGNIVSFIKTVLKYLDNGYSLQPLTVPSNYTNFTYVVAKDVRTSETGAAIDDTYNIGLYQFRPSPKNDLNVEEVAAIVSALPAGLHPASKAPTRNISQEEQDTVKNNPDFDESVNVIGADKVFLLSWHNTNAVQNKQGKYGFSQDDIHLTLQKETEPMVKGSMLLQLIVDLINLFEAHGHAGLPVNPGNTLNEDAKAQISQIKEKYGLLSPVAKDLSGGSLILNQYLRLN